MGVRSVLKRTLRQGLHRGRSGWQRLKSPLQERIDRDRLRAINALDRIQEVRLPGAGSSSLDRLVLFSHFHPKGWLQRCIRRELADLRERGWQVLLLSDHLDAAGLAWCESQEIGWLRRCNEGQRSRRKSFKDRTSETLGARFAKFDIVGEPGGWWCTEG